MAIDLNNKIHSIKFVFSRADMEKIASVKSKVQSHNKPKTEKTAKKNPCIMSVNKVMMPLQEDREYKVKIHKSYTLKGIEYCTMSFCEKPEEMFEYVLYADIEFQ